MTVITTKNGDMMNVEAVMKDKADFKGHRMIVAHIADLQAQVKGYQSRVCQMCDGHGAVGNILDSMDCPECTALDKAIGDAARLPLLKELSGISQQCIGEIAMSYKLDAQSIGESIYTVTGMTSEELSKL